MFDRYLLILNEFDGSPPSQMDFSKSPFWIQIHDMPLVCMNGGVGRKIGESLGEVWDVDVAGDGVGWGSFLRIRVLLDLLKPLERRRSLHIAGKVHWVTFKYEKLPLFCFTCGRIIHGPRGCPEFNVGRMGDKTVEKKWGVWLRADGYKRLLGDGGRGSVSDFREHGRYPSGYGGVEHVIERSYLGKDGGSQLSSAGGRANHDGGDLGKSYISVFEDGKGSSRVGQIGDYD